MRLSKPAVEPGSHDLDALAAFAEGRLDGADRQRVMAHLAECSECRRTLAGLGQALADGTLATGPAIDGRASAWRRPRVWMPIAASVLVGLFAWFLLVTWTEIPGGDDVTPVSEEDDLLRKRDAALVVAGKTFRRSDGEWVDSDYDSARNLPVITVRGSVDRAARLEQIPELAPYAEIGERVLVVLNDTVYRFEP